MIPILMYHQIGEPAPKGTPYRGLTVTPKKFRRQMHWMARLGYRGLSMTDLLPYIRGEQSGKVFGITFDDGYRNVLENALPVLLSLNFTSTTYFVANQFDGSNVWDHDKGIPPSPLMSKNEARRWVAAGQEAGSHTLDHVHLTKISSDLAHQQIAYSKSRLEDALQVAINAFCYPYGDENEQVRDMVRATGYSNATTTKRGLALTTDDLFGLPRVTVSRSTHLLRFLQKCLTGLEHKRRYA